ncbi:M42 family metallopeptidase [Mesomycoplasma lagogenitalium]|uniref:M42 family metallopeptidase n=1 Tax=Mesomycoplasma lagogenitalium TaxID=171286 RepID=A0ABY8LWH7_9BACT|nr:M42 family metallopeptidase [Mesomycoplasma lagogenitalium]WGI36913.1 M42 family metallopeptidase [Mesomycoplasma lagogenitalium]
MKRENEEKNQKNSLKNKVFLKLKEYMEIEGVSRNESDVAKAIIKNTQSENLNYSYDNFGSLIISKKEHNQGPKIMITAHMDEIGYAVLDILDNGQVRVVTVGGVWPNVIIGTKAKIKTSLGKEIYGVFGHTSIHILEREKITKAVSEKDLFVDFGFSNKKEAEEVGIKPGDIIYIHGETFKLFNPDLVVGKAMDNRAGVTVLDFIVNNIKDLQLPNQPYFVATVQEEVGTRGAKTSVSLVNPDIAIAIDTTSSHDTYKAIEGVQKLGLGVALRVQDGGTMMDPKLVKFIYNLAKEKNISVYKFVAQGGGTDAAELQYAKGGAATITISIPQRYLHSPLGVCDLNDLIAVIDLLTEFLKVMDSEKYLEIQYK